MGSANHRALAQESSLGGLHSLGPPLSVQQQAAAEGAGWLVTAESCDFPTRHTAWQAWSKEAQAYVLDNSIRCSVPKQSTVLTATRELVGPPLGSLFGSSIPYGAAWGF